MTATLNFKDATIKNGNSNGRYNVLNLEAGADVTLKFKRNESVPCDDFRIWCGNPCSGGGVFND